MIKQEHKLALVVKVKGAKSLNIPRNSYMLVEEAEGWVEATSSVWNGDKHATDWHRSPKLFNNEQEIKEFLSRWDGHPWYCKPYKTGYKVFKVAPVYKQVQCGWKYEQLENSK